MKSRWKNLLASTTLLTACVLSANAAPNDLPMNLVTLSTEVSQNVEQDTATIRLYTEQENANPKALAKEINQTLTQALNISKKYQPAIKSWSGGYQTWPVSNKNKIIKWRARAEIVLESKDFDAISQLAGTLSETMQIGDMSFSLSREKRLEVEKSLYKSAIEAFKAKAETITQQFGFQKYALVDIDFNVNTPGIYRARANMVMAADGIAETSSAKMAAPLSMAAGESQVTLRINGRIQMQK